MSSDGIAPFSVQPLPELHFGPGRIRLLPDLCLSRGRRLLLVTGSLTLRRSPSLQALAGDLAAVGAELFPVTVDREPSPELIDRVAAEFRDKSIDVVAAVGGGSVLDAGKALSAMLPQHLPVERFIEGREGFLVHDGRKVPFIAVPTTSGTGSEVTSNAVISRVGPDGFKRSLRHPAFVPDAAILDPELMVTAPPGLTASSGMDACTQLLEAYVSPFASPYTDALAVSGLERFGRSFGAACTTGAGDVAVRGDIAYAALMSGIALANAGLGIVHGFASSVGGLYDIPHGALCATLLAEATRVNIRKLQQLDSAHPSLVKFARAGSMLSGSAYSGIAEGCDALLRLLRSWAEQLDFPGLGTYGVSPDALDGIVAATRSKSNAIQLDADDMRAILLARL